MKMWGVIAAAASTIVMTTAVEARDHRDGPRWSDHRGDKRSNRKVQRREAEYRKDVRKAYQNGYRQGSRQASRPVYSYNNGRYNDVRYNAPRNNNYWWGSNGRMHCRRDDGTTGLIVGALAGGTLGNVIAGHGDKTVGSLIGGSLGAILGKEIAKGDVKCR